MYNEFMSWIFAIWVIAFWVVVILVLRLIIHFYRPYIQGWVGERFVSRQLHKLGAEDYVVLNNLLLPSSGSIKTTQIDHVVVSIYGVFCIETKDYAGWIIGNPEKRYWTQVLFSRNSAHRKSGGFYSPLEQNYGHRKAIDALLEKPFPNIKSKGFVIFPRADKLKVTGTDEVGYARDIIKKIKSFSTPELTSEERDKIVNILRNANIEGGQARKQHIKDVRAMLSKF